MFKSLAQILNLLIADIKKRHLAEEVYSGESKPKLTKTKYWTGVKALFENSEQNLLGKMGKDCKNLDRHKKAGLLLVSLLKRPLFIVNYGQKDRSIGYYSASITFAWKASLTLLTTYILNDDGIPKDYESRLISDGLLMPSESYEKDKLKTIELCFRSFHFKDSRRAMPAPFSELEGDKLAENKDWAWALVFADMFFLIEKASYYKFFVKTAKTT